MRQRQLRAPLVDQLFCEVELLFFDKRVACLESHCAKESARHRAADEHRIHLGQKLLDDIDLTRDLGTTEDSDERLSRIRQRAAKVFELAFHQQACYGRAKVFSDSCGGRVRAMGCAERIVHKKVTERGKRPGELTVIGFFPGEE